MTMLVLREYQQRSLETLEAYLRLASRQGAKMAFLHETERPYRSVPALPELPYVCLRVPTGGGKTLTACHALGMAAKELLQTEAMLDDGRILIVEYKGEHLWSNDDSKEKLAIGELWADRSDGKCVFVMPKGPDWGAIQAAIGE